MTKSASHVCPEPGCPELAPCPVHSRKPSDPWSKHRLDDRHERAKWRPVILQRDEYRCQRCGATTELEVHHRRGTATIRGAEDLVTLCRECNRRAG